MRERGTILVVDDEQAIYETVAMLLDDKYDLQYANSGSKGLVAARSGRFDLVLLDIGMSDINGYELCKMLKQDPLTQDIPIVFLTAFSSTEDEAAGLAVGAVDYITKPINPSILQNRVGTQIALKLQRDYLNLLVRQDGLTELTNRRGFEEILGKEWRRASRQRTPLSLLMIDIDSFKLYNDKYGHIAGDNCLKAVADKMNSVLRRGGDSLARYGGEEFVALMADTPFDFVELMAERFRSAIESLQIPHADSMVAKVVTISVGAATVIPTHHDEPMSLVAEADRMLYRVKQDGGNSVRANDLGGVTEVEPIKAVPDAVKTG